MFNKTINRIKDFLGLNKSVSDSSLCGVQGELEFTLKKADGRLITFKKQNLVVDGGLDFICNSLGASSGRPAVFSHIGVGTGTVAPANGNTTLVTELVRSQGTYSHANGTNFLTFQANFNEGIGTGALTEAAIFNASTGGIMFNRITFPVINKEADDGLVVTFKITFTRV